MILVDFTQMVVAGLILKMKSDPNFADNIRLQKHFVLKLLKYYIKTFKKEFGPDVVICCDNKHYWRREVFPYYKHGRKKIRDRAVFDWNNLFETVQIIKDDLRNNFPYRVIDIPGAEADDVIAVLTRQFAHNEKILILSADKDFYQLHIDENVHQYSPVSKGFIKNKLSADEYINTKILKGDQGDGVPNFLSADDTYANENGRQKTLTKKKLREYLDHPGLAQKESGYHRNKMLVDFREIPEKIKTAIIAEYDNFTTKNNKNKIFGYLVKNRLAELVDEVEDF